MLVSGRVFVGVVFSWSFLLGELVDQTVVHTFAIAATS